MIGPLCRTRGANQLIITPGKLPTTWVAERSTPRGKRLSGFRRFLLERPLTAHRACLADASPRPATRPHRGVWPAKPCTATCRVEPLTAGNPGVDHKRYGNPAPRLLGSTFPTQPKTAGQTPGTGPHSRSKPRQRGRIGAGIPVAVQHDRQNCRARLRSVQCQPIVAAIKERRGGAGPQALHLPRERDTSPVRTPARMPSPDAQRHVHALHSTGYATAMPPRGRAGGYRRCFPRCRGSSPARPFP